MKKYNYWTKERCISVAKKCNYRSELKKKFSGAWDSAFNNNWLDEVYSYLKPPNNLLNVWTKEKCKLICNNYISYYEFRKNEPKVYYVLYEKKWLDECCGHMIRLINKKNYLTKEKCLEEALKFTTKGDWIKYSRKSYVFAHKNNWIDYCSAHMIKLGCNHYRKIYSFTFSDNHVYVGLSYSPNERKNHHLNDEKSSVYKHIKKTKLIPDFNILTDYMEKGVASKEEGKILNNYRINNWIILNKMKTGGLGGSTIVWTENNCFEEALKYKTRAVFKKMSGGAYMSALKHGWLNKCCSHMKYLQLPNGYWNNNKNNCFEEALKFDNIRDFRINSGGAYNAIVKNGWYYELKEIYNK